MFRKMTLVVGGALLISTPLHPCEIVRTCADLKAIVGKYDKTFMQVYDGFTSNAKKNKFRRMENYYQDLPVKFLSLNVAENDLRECTRELGILCYPSFALFQKDGALDELPGDPSEDSMKAVLNKALGKDDEHVWIYTNPLYQTAQVYFRNGITQRVLPTTFQNTFPSIQQVIPKTFHEQFDFSCWRQCPPGDSCHDHHHGCCGGHGCGHHHGGCGHGGCGHHGDHHYGYGHGHHDHHGGCGGGMCGMHHSHHESYHHGGNHHGAFVSD